MWQQTRCLVLSLTLAGSLSVSWDMKVSPVVTVPRGEDAVLGCSFTHPKQQDYSGKITVKWLARESQALPFFSCSVQNDSMEELECSVPGLKYSLKGDPRRGELSLLIRRVHEAESGTYFCLVELDGWRSYFQKETHLYVTAEPQILSLSVVETSSGLDSATRSLQCKVAGHPLPTISWLSASGSLPADRVQTSQVGAYSLVSSVPYLEEDVFTCRAESRLGGAERRYPAGGDTLMTISLTVCGLIVLLLLLTAGFFSWRRNRAGAESPPVYENTDSARADASALYGNADFMETRRLRGSDPPAAGDVELHLVYSAVGLHTQHASLKSSTQHLEETGVFYSPVNVQL